MLVTGQVRLGEVASRLDAPVPVRISRLFEEELGGGGQPKRGMPLRTRPPDEVVRRFRLAACIARWLNAGVPIAEVARRVGNLPEVIQRRYHGCIDGHERSHRQTTLSGHAEVDLTVDSGKGSRFLIRLLPGDGCVCVPC